MQRKFINVKKLCMSIIIITIPVQMIGCSSINSSDMIKMIDGGQEISIELNQPDYTIDVKGTQQEENTWIQLDRLKTFNTGFRQAFDELFNIKTVTENSINGKSGCISVDSIGDRNGNTTIIDSLRNKVFATKYLGDSTVKENVAKLAS